MLNKKTVWGKTQYWVAQAKKRWVPVTEGGVGISTTLGAMSVRPATPDRPDDKDYYLNVPITVPLGQDRFVHINAGWVHHQVLAVSRPTWGLGGELPLTSRVTAIAETYGETHAGTRFQFGLRMWVVPQRVQIDTTYGNQVGQPENLRWFTVGVRGVLWSAVATIELTRQTLRPAWRMPSNACGLVTSWTKWRSM